MKVIPLRTTKKVRKHEEISVDALFVIESLVRSAKVMAFSDKLAEPDLLARAEALTDIDHVLAVALEKIKKTLDVFD